MLDLLLVASLGFLGSFGHCVGMCGPLTVAFSLSQPQQTWRQQLYFHFLLNLGRVISYALVGAGIGALGSVLIASGQMAGIGSELRRAIAILTGLMLIWFGLVQIKPELLPRLPVLHPFKKSGWHNRLNAVMLNLSLKPSWWTPASLGMIWGLIPCGFLYAAQLKAAQTGNLGAGAATMLAFGLGTMPSMVAIGLSASRLSADKRSQLFKLGGWIALTIGVITLLRTGDMADYTGHASLFCLILTLIARPISRLWVHPLRYRRALGVGAFVLAVAHTSYMLNHTLEWNFDAFSFLLPVYQWAIGAGALAVMLMTPAALTSFDSIQNYLGPRWRQIHLLCLPALLLSGIHTVFIGSHYFGDLTWSWENRCRTASLGLLIFGVLLVRWRWIWSVLSLERFYKRE